MHATTTKVVMSWNEENLCKLSIEELYKLYIDMKTKDKCDRPFVG